MNQTHVCHFCGAVLDKSAVHELDGIFLCADCLAAQTVECDCCHDRIPRSESIEHDSDTLCRYCYENNFTTCTECGTLIANGDARYPDDSDDPFCQDCYDKLYNGVIHHYHYKPSPLFYGGEGSSLFLGVELEIDEGGESRFHAQQILNLANRQKEHIYCKHDGSLDDGFEIVSHPMTLAYHQTGMNWKEVLAKTAALGYLSHNAGSCGLHIHCSRRFFGEDYEEQDMAIGRIIYLTERFWNELVKFSRRTQGSLNRWAGKYATISETVTETYQKAKNRNLGRYVAINLTNETTVEFRMFRGTLQYDTFMAALQLVDEICHLVLRMRDEELENLSWSEFVRRIDRGKKPELIAYLKSKQLYINEQTASAEEV